MAVNDDITKVVNYIMDWRARRSHRGTQNNVISFDAKEYLKLCMSQEDFYLVLERLHHDGLISNIDINDPEDAVPDEYLNSAAEEWPGEFVITLPDDFEQRLNNFNVSAVSADDDRICLHISRTRGVYIDSTTPPYRISGRRAKLLWFLKDRGITPARAILIELNFGSIQAISDDIHDINRTFTHTLECNPENVLIKHIGSGSKGYHLNTGQYQIEWADD